MSIAALAYPFAVYYAAGRIQPQWLVAALGLFSLARAAFTKDKAWLWVGAVTTVLAVGSVLSGQAGQMLKLYPVIVNAGFLAVFAASVFYPPTVIERFARLAEPRLSSEGVRYTRSVTLVWCVFFVFNGAIALATALWASDEAWTLYNGCLAYVAMGLLFAAEWLVRRRVRARAGVADRTVASTESLQLKDANG
jgi:uncharacterized membrane protein